MATRGSGLTTVGKDVVNCPVRCLRVYLTRTESHTRGRSCPRGLIVTPSCGSNVSPHHISSWIREVIRRSYAFAGKPIPDRLHCRPHELRALSASTALWRNVAVTDIVRAVGWRSTSTFGRFYLRDMTSDMRALDVLGGIVVAGAATTPLE